MMEQERDIWSCQKISLRRNCEHIFLSLHCMLVSGVTLREAKKITEALGKRIHPNIPGLARGTIHSVPDMEGKSP